MKIPLLLLLVICTSINAKPPVKSVDTLKQELYQLESEIFYTKHLSYFNTIREKTAFMVAIAGILGSGIAPFKVIESDEGRPLHTISRRMGVCAGLLGATAATAGTISYVRPILWYKEHKRTVLKNKIFELKSAQTI